MSCYSRITFFLVSRTCDSAGALNPVTGYKNIRLLPSVWWHPFRTKHNAS